MNAHDRETAVLRHMSDGMKFETDFVMLAREQRARCNQPVSVGGRAALRRCWANNWVEPATNPDRPWQYYWQLTEKGRAELEARK